MTRSRAAAPAASRADRRASRRVGLAATLLGLGCELSWVAFLTGVPGALLDLIGDERGRALAGRGPRSRSRQLVDLGLQFGALACTGACIVAVAERAAALSVVAAAGAVTAVAYRRRRARAAGPPGLPARDQSTDQHSAGRD